MRVIKCSISTHLVPYLFFVFIIPLNLIILLTKTLDTGCCRLLLMWILRGIMYHKLGLLIAKLQYCIVLARSCPRSTCLLLLLLFLPNEILNFNLKTLVTVGCHLVYELHELKTIQEKNSDCAQTPW